MEIDGVHYRTIWPDEDGKTVCILDQTQFPHSFPVTKLTTVDDAAHAISAMLVRGAPLIGATAAYGLAIAMRADPSDANLTAATEQLGATRPTAVNLRWALNRMNRRLGPLTEAERTEAAWQEAGKICDEDVETNSSIGENGLALIEDIAATKAPGEPVNVLTHCNAGWLATVDWGTATAPIYKAFNKGIPVHVYVDETRPRNQGAFLTAWELNKHGVPHTVVVDNAGGHLMQHGQVDLVIVGSDRTTAAGDVGNKIGTYLKALAAKDNHVPFYVALPTSTIDYSIRDGLHEIPIEERSGEEVSHMTGKTEAGDIATVGLLPDGSSVANPAFDVTPARYVSGLITEHGVVEPTVENIAKIKPEEA